MTAEEIEQLLVENSSFYAQNDPEFDKEVYRNKLTSNLGKTKIRMHDSGSITLGYARRQENRENTIDMLRSLFPGALILSEHE